MHDVDLTTYLFRIREERIGVKPAPPVGRSSSSKASVSDVASIPPSRSRVNVHLELPSISRRQESQGEFWVVAVLCWFLTFACPPESK